MEPNKNNDALDKLMDSLMEDEVEMRCNIVRYLNGWMDVEEVDEMTRRLAEDPRARAFYQSVQKEQQIPAAPPDAHKPGKSPLMAVIRLIQSDLSIAGDVVAEAVVRLIMVSEKAHLGPVKDQLKGHAGAVLELDALGMNVSVSPSRRIGQPFALTISRRENSSDLTVRVDTVEDNEQLKPLMLPTPLDNLVHVFVPAKVVRFTGEPSGRYAIISFAIDGD